MEADGHHGSTMILTRRGASVVGEGGGTAAYCQSLSS